MALRTKKVISLSEIPKGVVEGHWITRHFFESYIEVHLDEKEIEDNLDVWLESNYPELIEEDSFFIFIDC